MRTEQYTCDVCGATRGEGNHWLKMSKAKSDLQGPWFLAWTQAEGQRDVAHICSASCAHKALDAWLTQMQAKSHSTEAR